MTLISGENSASKSGEESLIISRTVWRNQKLLKDKMHERAGKGETRISGNMPIAMDPRKEQHRRKTFYILKFSVTNSREAETQFEKKRAGCESRREIPLIRNGGKPPLSGDERTLPSGYIEPVTKGKAV